MVLPHQSIDLHKLAHELDQKDLDFLHNNTQCNVYRDDLEARGKKRILSDSRIQKNLENP